jgi:hypothetical protein
LYNYCLFDSFISCLTNLFSFLGEVSFAGGEEQCLQDRACSVFDKAATKVVRDMMSNSRIQCVCLYYKKIKLQDMNKKLGASEIYLQEDEYLQVDISGLAWLRKCPDAWRALCAYWASPSFVEKSRMKRANR